MTMSMTGFARRESQFSWGKLSCEMRSVNHRYLELFIKTPESLKPFEMDFRDMVKSTLSRGKVELQLYLKTEDSSQQMLEINQPLVSQLTELSQQVQNSLTNASHVNALDLLRWPGVLQTAAIDPDELKQAAISLVSDTIKLMIANRQREGLELKGLIEERLIAIAGHAKKVRAIMPVILEQNNHKLRAKLEALQIELDEDRFVQEVVYAAQKSDVAEELDRLETHLIEVRKTLEDKKPVGRRLDFLMQELNREANTLGSKSINAETTQISVDLKVLIEQMREQIQNIE